MDTHSDTEILNCYRCMKEWETYVGREKWGTTVEFISKQIRLKDINYI